MRCNATEKRWFVQDVDRRRQGTIPGLILAFCLGIPAAVAAELPADDPRSRFFDRLTALCDAEYVGGSSFPADPDDAFYGKRLVAKFASCTDAEVRIPFAVGNDQSRTWIVTRSEAGLRLQHDHRHADGTPDEITMYGGWASAEGSLRSQSFAADQHTRELIPAAATNVWTLSFDSEGRLTYYLERHGEPRFKATLVPTESGRR